MLRSLLAFLRKWQTPIKAGVTAVLLVALFTSIDPAQILSTWKHIEPAWFLLALAAVVPNLFAQFGRWWVGLRRAHTTAGRRDTLRSLMIGIAMGAVTPGRVGEMGLVMFLPSGGRRKALGVMAVLRAYIFVASISLGLAMWSLMPGLAGIDVRTGRAVALAALVAVVVLVAVGEYLIRISRHPRLERVWSELRDMIVGVHALRPVDRALFVVWSWLCSAVYLTQQVWLMRAFGGDVGWLEGLAAGAITFAIVAVVPIAVGNIGVREGAAAYVWQHLGIEPAVAVNAAFMLFFINVLLPGLFGLIWNAKSGLAIPSEVNARAKEEAEPEGTSQ